MVQKRRARAKVAGGEQSVHTELSFSVGIGSVERQWTVACSFTAILEIATRFVRVVAARE